MTATGPQGVGELFGQSFDAVFRRPLAAVVVILFDLAGLALGILAFAATTGATLVLPGGYRLTAFPYGIPEAMPSVADVHDQITTDALRAVGVGPALVFLAVMVPVTAFAEGGFIDLLARLYGGKEAKGETSLLSTFLVAARKHFARFLAYRAFLALLAVFTLFVAPRTPYFSNYALGAFLIEFLLLFAPYVIVFEDAGAIAAVRGSVRLVADHLASSLVMLLFLLLTTGGAAVLLGPLVAVLGAGPGLVVAAFLYAPVGASLALFIMNVYRSFRPEESLAEPVVAPTASAAPA